MLNLKDENMLLYKITQKVTTEKFYYYYIISMMIVIPVAELIFEFFNNPFFNQPVIITAYGAVGCFSACMYLVYKREKKVLYPTFIFFLTLIFFMLISLIFSEDIMESLDGSYYDEEIAHFLAYFSLMFAGTMINEETLRKNVLRVFCLVALIQGIVSFLQTLGIRICDCFFDPEWHRTDNICFGLTQHNNFFAGLSILFVGATLGLFVFEKTNKKYIYLLLSALSFYVSICTGARIAWVGNSMVLLFYIISLAVARKKISKSNVIRFASGVAVFVCILVIIAMTSDVLLSGANDFEREFADGASIEGMGSSRVYIWKFGLASVPSHWLTGIGLDNYRYAFFSNPDWHEGMFTQGKGHNEYIHTLVTEGVPAVINYIVMLVYVCVTGIKNILNNTDEKNVFTTWIFLGMFAGYAAQACFNSSVINTAMYFWITIGMVAPIKNQKLIGISRKS